MASWQQLYDELQTVTGLEHIYYQPPETIKLVYPCIVASLEAPHTKYAEGKIYKYMDRYSLTLIVNEYDSELPKQLLYGMSYIELDRPFKSDNLYHYAYTLYY